MACYCGFSTAQNKVRWAVAALFTALSFVMMRLVLAQSATCLADLQKIHPDTKDPHYDPCVPDEASGELPDECIDCAFVSLYFLGLVLTGVAATVPLYVMCCCTATPARRDMAPHTMPRDVPAALVVSTAPASADGNGSMRVPLLSKQAV